MIIKVTGAVVLVALVLAYFVRGRVAGARANSRTDNRPTLPPSPYQPSRGFRILDGSEPVQPHPVVLPRIDATREFAFHEPSTAPLDLPAASARRHNEQWALDRSMRHVQNPHVRRRRRLAWTIVIVVLATGLIVVLLTSVHPQVHHAGVGVGRALGIL